MEVDVPESFWTEEKGYSIIELKEYQEGEIETVEVPLTNDSVVTIPCPYCSYPRKVEPDANYQVDCEGCGKPYRIASQI
jgi:hypothetical protein